MPSCSTPASPSPWKTGPTRTTSAPSGRTASCWPRGRSWSSIGGITLEIGDGYARLGRRAKGVALLERFEREAGYRVEPITEALYRAAVDLYRSRPDKEWGLTDCVSFVLMEREKITEALTPDPHFRQAGFVALLLEPDPPG